MSKIYVDQVDPKTATTLTLGTSGDTITVPSGVTFGVSGTMNASSITAGTLAIAQGGTGAATFAAAGLVNTPAFLVTLSGNQSIANSTLTKITFDTEVFDTDGTFASNKFTPAIAGKYFIVLSGRMSGFTDAEEFNLRFGKNGSAWNFGDLKIVSAGASPLFLAANANLVIDLNTTDYIEGYVLQNQGGAVDLDATYTYMAGFKLIGA